MKRRVTTVVAGLLRVLGIQAAETPAATAEHVYHGEFDLGGRNGTFHLSLLFGSSGGRSWFVGNSKVGNDFIGGRAYSGLRGSGHGFYAGGHADAWYARVEGFVTRPGKTKQRVVIKLKGRPGGTFVLTPKQPGFLKPDRGEYKSGWIG